MKFCTFSTRGPRVVDLLAGISKNEEVNGFF